MHVKVANFKISCLQSQRGIAKGFTGTYCWMAPEMIKEKHHTNKVDVYSFSIVFWELVICTCSLYTNDVIALNLQ